MLASREQALATSVANVDAKALFDWAEYKFPDLFAKGAQNQPFSYLGVDYTIRAYPGQTYLGLTTAGEVYGLGPFTQNVLTPFGKLSDYAAQVVAEACQVNPADCVSSFGAAGNALAAGYDITLAVRADGGVLQLASATPWSRAPGTTLPAGSARLLDGLSAASVSLERSYALAVGLDLQVYGWGINSNGLLGGAEGNGNVAAPRLLVGVSGVRQALATQAYSLALKEDGSVWHWPGVLTIGAAGSVSEVRAVPALADARSLASLSSTLDGSSLRPAVIRADGSVAELTWTVRNSFGPSGTVQTHTAVATAVPGLADVERISCNLSHCLALTRAGTVLEWNGAIGLSPTAVPRAVPNLGGVVAVAALSTASVAVTGDGKVWTWGSSPLHGQGTGRDIDVPTVLGLPAAAKALASGWQHVSVRLADGSLWGWGANQGRQLGDGSTVDRSVPVKAAGVIVN